MDSRHPIVFTAKLKCIVVFTTIFVLLNLVVKQGIELEAISDLTGINGPISKQLMIAKAVCESRKKANEVCELRYYPQEIP